ncbi:reverse transcriptase domain-containing protein [Tanacetum coccineum]
MTAIFHDMVEDFMEVFMDDFSVFGNSFNCCLANLDKILARCEETNLVLNWEKCHFMVKEGIILGHKIYGVGSENLAADHLSRLENPNLGAFTEKEIADEFFDEHLMILKAKLNDDEPWYADYVNYIVGKIMPPKWTPDRRRRFFSQHIAILDQLGDISVPQLLEKKVYESGFFWPNIFKDAKDYVMRCDACQRSGNILSRSEMPQNNIQLDITRRIGLKSSTMHCGHFNRLLQNTKPTGKVHTPFRLVYEKAYHLPVEIKHKAYWALKQCNMDLAAAAKNSFMELNELMELRDGAYKNTRIYKERTQK